MAQEVNSIPPFSKYTKFGNHYEPRLLQELDERGLLEDTVIWVAQEKIHGANFSLTTDGKRVWPAKRSSYLHGSDARSFYRADTIAQEFTAPLQTLYQLLKKEYPALQSVSVYGELFGGAYPLTEEQKAALPTIVPTKAVQRGIYYSPYVTWIPFDIRLVGAGQDHLGYIRDLDQQRDLLQSAGFRHLIPEVKRGTWKEMMAWNIEQENSRIPELLGLPALSRPNIWEGVVLRPLSDTHTLVKYKTKRFAEIQGGGATEEKKGAAWQPTDAFQERVKQITQEYLNLNRVAAVASKELPQIHPKRLAALVVKDAFEDLKYAWSHAERGQAMKACMDPAFQLCLTYQKEQLQEAGSS